MSGPAPVPPAPPDPSSLESLNDLIRQQQQQQRPSSGALFTSAEGVQGPTYEHIGRRRASTGGDTVVPGSGTGNDDDDDGEVGDRSDDGQQAASSSVTIRASASSPASQRPRDESRWNGFHLWRAESYQRRVTQEQEAEDGRRNADRRSWRYGTVYAVQRWVRRWYSTALALDQDEDGTADMSRLKLLLLTVVLAGAQVAWCLEFGYGTPYLLSLGLSKASTSLVWLAAPLSGLVVQPLIGVLSDMSMSKYRRRQYIAMSSIMLSLCTLILAFSLPIASALADILHAGLADWDPARKRARDDINCFLAVTALIGLDISINGLQASARALVLDTAPPSLHSRANAWSARMMHAGGVFGYAAGWFDLSSSTWLAWLGGGQFRKYAVISLLSVLVCSAITCACIDETANDEDHRSDAHLTQPQQQQQQQPTLYEHGSKAIIHIWQTIRRLPRPVRRICLVQLFAFMGWFPFLFYATEWIIEVWQAERAHERSRDDEAVQLGSFALLMYAIVSLIAGALLPYLALANWKPKPVRLEGPEGQLPDAVRNTAARRKSKPPRWRLSLRTFWTFSLLLYSFQMVVLTFAARTAALAIALVASVGIPWAVALWVPFALVMESVREAEDGMSPFEFEADWFAPERVRDRRESRGAEALNRARVSRALQDCGPLSRNVSNGNGGNSIAGSVVNDSSGSEARKAHSGSILTRGGEIVSECSPTRHTSGQAHGAGVPVPVAHGSLHGHGGGGDSLGATILGVHNMAIVLPQLLVALIAAVILRDRAAAGSLQHLPPADGLGSSLFALFASPPTATASTDGVGVVWVLRFGGLAAFCGALLTRFVPLARSERQLMGHQTTAHLDVPRFDDEASESSSDGYHHHE